MSNVLEDIIMVNQINDHGAVNQIGLNRIKNNDRQKNEAVTEQTSVPADSVNLSQAAKKLDAIKTSLKDAPEVDSKKVAYFKEQIANGNYQPNSKAIAQKMYEMA